MSSCHRNHLVHLLLVATTRATAIVRTNPRQRTWKCLRWLPLFWLNLCVRFVAEGGDANGAAGAGERQMAHISGRRQDAAVEKRSPGQVWGSLLQNASSARECKASVIALEGHSTRAVALARARSHSPTLIDFGFLHCENSSWKCMM